MCGYCGKPLSPGLIEGLRTDLPETDVTSDDAGNPGNIALVNPDGANANGGWQLEAAGISFRSAEGALTGNAWTGDDAFVFNARGPAAESGGLTSALDLRLSSLMEQEGSRMSSQDSEIPDTGFWTYYTVTSGDDWHF